MSHNSRISSYTGRSRLFPYIIRLLSLLRLLIVALHMVAGLHKEVEEFRADLFIVHVQTHFYHGFLPFSEKCLVIAASDDGLYAKLVAKREKAAAKVLEKDAGIMERVLAPKTE